MKILNKRWERYWSSCESLKADIKQYGEGNFTKGIIRFHFTQKDLDLHELNLQMACDVLRSNLDDGSFMFYNRAIHRVGFNTTGLESKSKGKKRENYISPMKGKKVSVITPAMKDAWDRQKGVQPPGFKKANELRSSGLLPTTKGRVVSESTKQLLREARSKQVIPPEAFNRGGAKRKGVKRGPYKKKDLV